MSTWPRRHARRALVQAIYQWQIAAHDPDEIRSQFFGSGTLKKADKAYFDRCLDGVIAECKDLDAAFAPYLDRKVGELNQVERAILRAGTFELRACPDVPFKVVLDEYISLARTFGAQDSYKYVNGVLDRVARDLRPEETQ
ncbi:MAG: transcription antitermination factor NusB [Gammaproteobacteria bacterium]|nr:transcription antitermination factor NusB [Gammaproteobacteria bacterium]